MKNYALIILEFAIYSFCVAFSSKIYITFFLPILVLLFIRKNEIYVVLKKLVFLNFFLILLVLGTFFEGNFALGILIFLRSNLIVLFGILLFCGAKSEDISQGILDLKLGKKLSSLIYFCLIFINSLKSEFARLKTVLKIRGFSTQTSVFTYKIYANLIALLLLFALKKSENLHKTLIVRGFDGVFYHLEKPKFGKSEVLFLAFTILCVIFKFGVVI